MLPSWHARNRLRRAGSFGINLDTCKGECCRLSDADNFKSKMIGLEREVKSLKRDLRSKDETVAKMEEELKRLRSRNQRSEEEVGATLADCM